MAEAKAFFIRVVSAPSGEAPQWVREAWIGLVLPLTAGHHGGPVETMPAGVLSGPIGFWKGMKYLMQTRGHGFMGYQVESHVALEILSRSDGAATQWWRQHCPKFFDPGHQFGFDSHVALLLNHRQEPIPPLPVLET